MVHTFELDIAGKTLTIETGKLAYLADAAVTVRYGDSVALVTAGAGSPREGIDFLPLTVDYEERHYAAGKIPGSFFRREGRPSQDAILSDRLTDRTLRPLFPKGFRNEVQIIVTILSADRENPPDLLSIIGASAALSISDIPWSGPVSATRIGYIDGALLVNPTFSQLGESLLDIVVAGSKDAVVMVEAGAKGVPERVALEAIERAQQVNREVIGLQERMVAELGKPKFSIVVPETPSELEGEVQARLNGRLQAAIYAPEGKPQRQSAMDVLKTELVDTLGERYTKDQVLGTLDSLEKREVRSRILGEGIRPDGRTLKEIRPISCEVGVLPRAHGTGLFCRGLTQALTIATLGSVREMQKLDTLSPEESKRFMHHYNFPPYSVGEVRRMGGPGRREIGHGALAERALEPVVPSEEDFPYTIRLVSEILSSNGSTSMASVCGSTLALMDAGVPISAPVAGIAMGLITDPDGRFAVLTDIQGLEDHMGDMDFKVAGTAEGITALQMDIKVTGIGYDVMAQALEQAREARMYVLDRLRETISQARPELSPFAPRMYRLSIPVDKIGAVIGPGGKIIRGMIEEYKVSIDVDDNGTVTIGSNDPEAAQSVVERIQEMTQEVEVGKIYTGRVTRLMGFGAFVEVLPGKEGLVHISQLADYRVANVEDVVQVGDEITVVVSEIDNMGRVNLSRRALLEGEGSSERSEGQPPRPDGGSYQSGAPQRDARTGGDRGGPSRPPYQGSSNRGDGRRSGPPTRSGPPSRSGPPPRSGPPRR